MHHIRLQAVDSRYATDAELKAARINPDQLPIGIDGQPARLVTHQAYTVRALRSGHAPIILNEAMTGDGKTMAGRFQLMTERWRSFALFPTNALAYDQQASFRELSELWQPPVWNGKMPRERLISAYEIDQFSFGDTVDVSRKDEIQAMLTRRDYILTNPDIFHLIMNFAYKQRGEASDFMPNFVAQRFKLYIFDEFHLFGVAEIASVMIAMLLIRRLRSESDPARFLFLSATPQKMLQQLADRIGLAYEAPIKGEYAHGETEPPLYYRRILRQVDLYLHTGTLEDWVRANFETVIKPFFAEQRPAAKGIIIANSVATAHRVYAYLMPLCNTLGIRVGINTGLTPKADRTTHFDLLIATSTVDVGVDFKINFLVFESRDAASHTQRLGRLGRHTADVDGNPFQTYQAYALLPAWVIEGLMNDFGYGDSIRRDVYKERLEGYFAPSQQFASYIYHWAGIQAGKVLAELKRNELYTQYSITREELKAEFKNIFGNSVQKYWSLSKEGSQEKIRVASTFRASSPFTALVQDPQTNSREIVSYNLMSLLRRAELFALPIDNLLKQAQQRGQNTASLTKTEPLAAYQLRSWLDDYRKISIRLDRDFMLEWDEQVETLNRLQIECAGIPELSKLNNELYGRKMVVFPIVDQDPYTVRRMLRLGIDTELFEFIANNGVKGTMAFGRDALMLDSVYQRRRSSNQDPLIW